MTLPVQTPLNRYTYTGATTFPYSFLVLVADDLVVSVDGVVVNPIDYTVAGVGSVTGGSITYVGAALTIGQTVAIERSIALERLANYQELGDFLAGDFNADFDRLWMALQDTTTMFDARALRAPIGESINELPVVAVRKGLLLGFDAVTGQPVTAGPTSGSSTALALLLAGGLGSLQVGTMQIGAGAILREVGDKLNEIEVNAADYIGFDATGVTTSDVAIQDAITHVYNQGGGTVWFPVSLATFSVITPKSGVTLRGKGAGIHLRQLLPGVAGQTGIYKAPGGGSLTNFELHNLNIDGQRASAPTWLFTNIMTLEAGANESITDIRVLNCSFQDAMNNFISLPISATTGRIRRVRVSGCSFVTTLAKRFTSGYASDNGLHTSLDAVRLEQTYDPATGGDGYGQIVYTDCEISGCYAESIRTLGDYKRGGQGLILKDCRTVNMYDCHHSVDGCFDFSISGMVGRLDAGYTGPTTATDFVEVQGERGSVTGCSFDGGGLMRDGIYVSSYGRPSEPNNRGHNSVGVNVSECAVRGFTGTAFRLSNTIACSVQDCFAQDSVSGKPAGLGSGSTDGKTDGSSPTAYLHSADTFVGRIRSRNVGSATSLSSDAVGSRYAPCPNELGQDYYDVGSTSASLGTGGGATTIGNALNAPYYNDGYRELNANPLLAFQDSGSALPVYYAGTATAGSVAPPNGVPAAVTLTDANAGAISYLQASATPLLSQGQRLYMRIAAQYNSSAKWSIQIDELDSSSVLIASYYFGLTNFNLSGGGWIEYDFCHIAQNANCFKVAARLNPAAAASTDAATTGANNFANWRWARTAIGVT